MEEVASTNLFDDLPQINQGRLVPERHLQSRSLRYFMDGFNRRLNEPTTRQPKQQAVADFVLVHRSRKDLWQSPTAIQ